MLTLFLIAAIQTHPYEDLVQEAALRYDVPYALVKAVIKQESNFNPRAVSRCGARGLMQLMAKTAERLGVKNRFDPRQNIDGGVRYLSQMYSIFGEWRLAIAAYNAGPVNILSGRRWHAETRDYVKKVTMHWERFVLAGRAAEDQLLAVAQNTGVRQPFADRPVLIINNVGEFVRPVGIKFDDIAQGQSS